jgi:chromatin remodeling complex protein RSC6
MARQTKQTKSTVADETVTAAAPVVSAPVVAAAPVEVAAPKVKKTVAKKETKVDAAPAVAPAASAPVVAAPVVAAPVEDVVVGEVESSLSEQSSQFFSKLQQLSVVISSLKSEYRALEKKWMREVKTNSRANRKKRKTGNRAPSGFVKPTRISDELASFLGKSSGSEMARTEVTRDINQYIRANKLQDTTNGRKINPDSKLAGLLKIKQGEELTYFNLQRYMSPHFAKTDKTAVAQTSA